MTARPWLKDLAEGAGKFALAIIKKKPAKWRDDDAAVAAFAATWAAHWAHKVNPDLTL